LDGNDWFISELYIIPGENAKLKLLPLRTVNSDFIGALVSVRGIVTRTSDIKPCMTCCSYICDVCGFELYQTIPGKTFLPLIECPGSICQRNQTRGKLFVQVR
jgi:DNA replication licensing factor MCM7